MDAKRKKEYELIDNCFKFFRDKEPIAIFQPARYDYLYNNILTVSFNWNEEGSKVYMEANLRKKRIRFFYITNPLAFSDHGLFLVGYRIEYFWDDWKIVSRSTARLILRADKLKIGMDMITTEHDF